MGKQYSQLGAEERGQIEILLKMDWSLRSIGRFLGRSGSTISRELARNGQHRAKQAGALRAGIYVAVEAGKRSANRRRLDARFKLARQPGLWLQVKSRLAMGHSPQQVSGRLALEPRGPQISHESIYRFIYDSLNDKKHLHRLLPKRRYRRGQGKRGGAKQIARRVSVHDRPGPATERAEPGHWEADLMLFSKPGQALIVVHERVSRMTLLKAMPDRRAAHTARTIKAMLKGLPAAMRRSMTFDNGPEFFLHHRLVDQIGLDTYFCDLRAPWQKGGVENLIGRLRRDLPRKTDLNHLTAANIRAVQEKHNIIPRHCLDFQTPKEVFSNLVQTVALQT